MKNPKFKKAASRFASKEIIAFDLDETLTQSKADLDPEMASLFCSLLAKKIVAVVGGGKWLQFQNQLIAHLSCTKTQLENLFLLPNSGGSFYGFRAGRWTALYKNPLTRKEKTQIFSGFRQVFLDFNYLVPLKVSGQVLEDCESQITFSALGSQASLDQKKAWNTQNPTLRFKLQVILKKYLPNFEIRIGGLTSIDVTKKGIDKAYGLHQLMKLLQISKDKIVYVGDSFFVGGNDHVIKGIGIDIVKVKNPEETKFFIQSLISSL